MKTVPKIIVQLIHIEGPLKGEIQEYSEPEIFIGRNPTCQVQFPKDMTIISRTHASIIREGNRFKVRDNSANGTLLNGKRVEEAYLKDGDVLTISEGGPKVSFLTQVKEGQVEDSDFFQSKGPQQPDMPPKRRQKTESVSPEVQSEPSLPQPHHEQPSSHQPRYEPVSPPKRSKSVTEKGAIQTVQAPLIIQYGPTLRSFDELPITIGRSPQCDFMVHHPNLFDHHAQFFYDQDQYWVKDLSGKNSILINGQPIYNQAPLKPDNRLSLSPSGPSFRFLGGGRLAEIDEPTNEGPPTEEPFEESVKKKRSGSPKEHRDKVIKGAKSVLNKFLHR